MSDRIRTAPDAPWIPVGEGLAVSSWLCALCSSRKYSHAGRRKWRGLWVCVGCAERRAAKKAAA